MVLNPYKVTFAVLKPVKGPATKADQVKSGFMRDLTNQFLSMHAPDLVSAKKKVNSLKGKLSKDYEVFFITDKQFGNIKIVYKNGKMTYSKSYVDVATTKQLSEKFLLKGKRK